MTDRPAIRIKTDAQGRGLVLGLEAFERISAVEGIRLTDAMRRDLRSLEQRGLSSEERTRFIADRYGREPA